MSTKESSRPCQNDKESISLKAEKRTNSSLVSLASSWSALVVLACVAVMYGSINAPSEPHSMRILDEEALYQEGHKPLFPLNHSDTVGFSCAIIGLIVAAGGGIGGGGILVPIYILIMGFSPKHAIPLSNITVFGGAMANTYLNAKKRHPLADRPLVDWDLILIMEPLTIAGALMGAFLNKLLPDEVLVILLVLLLSFTAYNTLKKAMKMYKIETEHFAATAGVSGESELTAMAKDVEEEEEEEAEDGLLGNMEQQDNEADAEEDGMIDITEISDDLKVILEEEKVTPSGNVTLLMSMFVVVLFINVMKGGGAFPSPLGIECGSPSFWAANFIMLGWIVIISIMARSYLLNRYERKRKCGYQYVEGDIKWDPRATFIYPLICALAGFFAGMFGVGGGIVKGPLMLAMGVHPKVSSASSATMILFTSFTASTSFMVFGLLIPDYAIICLLIGFVATFGGQIALYYLMNKYQRNSYIAFSIGGVVLLSAFLMTIQSIISLADKDADEETSGICGVEA